MIQKNVVLKKNSTTFNAWLDPPAKIYRKYYIFHVLNADEVVKGKEKPKLLERGPYVFREEMQKKNVSFLEDDTLINYSPMSTLYYEANMSNGSLSDIVTFINVPVLVRL